MIENVIKEINYLVKVYGQNGFFGDGNKSLDYPESIPYAEDVKVFYSKYNPVEKVFFDFGSSVLYIFPLEELANLQSGYRFGSDGAENSEWKDSFVIGLFDDEPIIVEAINDTAVIKASFESGCHFEISENIEMFFNAVLCVLNIQYIEFGNEPLDDVSLDFKPEFIKSLRNELFKVLGDKYTSNFVGFFFG